LGFRLEKKMIDLALSGLPLQWDGHNRKLVFGQGMDQIDPALRTMEEMSNVLFERENAFGQGEDSDTPLYYMYRDLHLAEHRLLFREEGIRYDVTVLIPGTLGKEYIKTAGHYHPFKPGTNCSLSYAEAPRL
jgi:glucose-6-phosphate isomerase